MYEDLENEIRELKNSNKRLDKLLKTKAEMLTKCEDELSQFQKKTPLLEWQIEELTERAKQCENEQTMESHLAEL